MHYLIYILFGVIIGVGLGMFFVGQKRETGESDSLKKAREVVRKRKEGEKKKILDLVKKKGKITNNDVEKLLKVSDSTATNYLSELEQEGRIVQHGGETGRGVFYTSKKRPK